MISVLLIVAAAFFNSIMDAVENENINESKIFSRLNPKFWYKRESWKYAKRVFGYSIDAWHLSKSLMVISFCCSVLTYNPILPGWYDFFLFGLAWNATFKLFYNGIFGIE